jgi:hypothetical protein
MNIVACGLEAGMSESERPSIARQRAWLPRYCRRVRHTNMKHSSETLGGGVFYRGRLTVIKDRDIQNHRDEGQ